MDNINATVESQEYENYSSIIRMPTSLVHNVKFRKEQKFNVKQLPKDAQRIYRALTLRSGEDYALTCIFLCRTAIELHRAWHMTLLTHSLLQQLKDKFNLRITWDLGVLKLKFQMEDGTYELNRKVPYDYDSEYQDLYSKVLVALVEGDINIHQALNFQVEIKAGIHTARSGLFFRNYPGRLVLYPLEAATCTVIFFGGDWADGGIAAICGLVAGLIEWGTISRDDRTGKASLDVLVGFSAGIIAGLFFRYVNENFCLQSIFLGTLYWFFYGTAFVIGLLEIIAGMLRTGVIRFMAVSVKTFVLSLGAGFGLMLTANSGTYETWGKQGNNCGTIDLHSQWWRIPLYLLCSVSALGQYRFPVVDYYRGLIVQLVAYEVQYELLYYFQKNHKRDNMDLAAANVAGAAAAVITACGLSFFIDRLRRHYYGKILNRKRWKMDGHFGRWSYFVMKNYVKLCHFLRLSRATEITRLQLAEHICIQESRGEEVDIHLEPKHEEVFVETIVSSQNLNVWAICMPAVYQLVPGAMIAKLWFNVMFPPTLQMESGHINPDYSGESSVFSNLMVISTSLAIGLILGFALVQITNNCTLYLWHHVQKRHTFEDRNLNNSTRLREVDRAQGACMIGDDDPSDLPQNETTHTTSEDFDEDLSNKYKHSTGISDINVQISESPETDVNGDVQNQTYLQKPLNEESSAASGERPDQTTTEFINLPSLDRQNTSTAV